MNLVAAGSDGDGCGLIRWRPSLVCGTQLDWCCAGVAFGDAPAPLVFPWFLSCRAPVDGWCAVKLTVLGFFLVHRGTVIEETVLHCGAIP